MVLVFTYHPLHPLLDIACSFGIDINDYDRLNNPDLFLDILNILLDSDMNINITDNEGSNILLSYIGYNYNDKPSVEIDNRVITLFIKAGIDLNYKTKHHNDKSVLMCIIDKNLPAPVTIDILKMLIEYGADIYQVIRHNLTLLSYCLSKLKTQTQKNDNLTEILRYLLSIVDFTKTTGNELLNYCATPYPNIEIMNILVNWKHIDINRTNRQGHNALMALLCRDRTPTLEMITTLINANININYKSKRDYEHSALFYVCYHKYPIEIYNTLIEHGADPTIVGVDETYIFDSYLNDCA